MGAWGVKPFENDSAGDWLGTEYERIEAAVERATSAVGDEAFLNRCWTALAAIGLFLLLSDANGGYGDPDLAWDGIAVVDRMLDINEPELAGWVNPNKRRDELKDIKKRLQRVWNKFERRSRRKRR